jgi:hypothetical protein
MLSAVRDGKLTPLVCPHCGCRLNFVTAFDTAFAHHFMDDLNQKDAQGCDCPNIGMVWVVDVSKIEHLIT